MNHIYMEGLSAALQFNCNLLQALCLITIVRPWFSSGATNNFIIVIEFFMDKLYTPLRFLTRLFPTEKDLAPYLFLAMLIPIQFTIMAKLRIQ